MELWGDNSAEKFAHASLLLNAWKQYEQTNIRLRYYWEQARDATDSVITKSGKSLYTPNNQLTGESYRKLFYDDAASVGSGEIIYDSQFTSAERSLWLYGEDCLY